VYRPEGTSPDAKLPVLLYIHGGSFWIGSKDELVIQPGGLIKRSVDIGIPMMSVTINYRLGGKLLPLIYPYPTDLEG
jgi:carboxylesterase type B